MITKGRIELNASKRIDSVKLGEELDQALGGSIGWAVERSPDGTPIAFRYEFLADSGYDPKVVESTLRAHSIEPNEPDDIQQAENNRLRQESRTDKLKEVLEGWDALVTRVAALEGGRK